MNPAARGDATPAGLRASWWVGRFAWSSHLSRGRGWVVERACLQLPHLEALLEGSDPEALHVARSRWSLRGCGRPWSEILEDLVMAGGAAGRALITVDSLSIGVGGRP